MTKQKWKIMKGHSKFKEWIDEIKWDRVKKGKDKKPLSDTRLTLAIKRVPNLKEFIVNSDIKKNGKKKFE